MLGFKSSTQIIKTFGDSAITADEPITNDVAKSKTKRKYNMIAGVLVFNEAVYRCHARYKRLY